MVKHILCMITTLILIEVEQHVEFVMEYFASMGAAVVPTWASTKPSLGCWVSAMPSSRRQRSWRTLMLGRWAGSSEGFASAGLESGSRPWSSPDPYWCPTRTCYWVTGGGHMPSCHSDSGAGLGEARSSHDSLHPCALPAAVQEIWIFEEYSPPVFEAVHPQAHEWCRCTVLRLHHHLVWFLPSRCFSRARTWSSYP